MIRSPLRRLRIRISCPNILLSHRQYSQSSTADAIEVAKPRAHQSCSWTGSINQHDDYLCIGRHKMRAACAGTYRIEHLVGYDFRGEFAGWAVG
jgi:hypothetical protein